MALKTLKPSPATDGYAEACQPSAPGGGLPIALQLLQVQGRNYAFFDSLPPIVIEGGERTLAGRLEREMGKPLR